jgi:glycolate oxidase iron-sulfur subunit
MQTRLADWIRDTAEGVEDSPRGRIYLMKQMLEGAPVTRRTQLHLDRCVTCRACETTCPSGVEYGRLVDIGRNLVEKKVPRAPWDRFRRWMLKSTIPHRGLFAAGLALGRWIRPVLPASLARKIQPRRDEGSWPAARHPRRMIVLAGCVQPAMAPGINAATARVLDRIGISLVEVPAAGCCGAVTFHLNYQEEALAFVKANIDAWWPHVEAGAEAIVITASGCGTMVKEYGHLLGHDPAYAAKAARIVELAKDVAEVIAAEQVALAARLVPAADGAKVAFHSPCSLQHGLKLNGIVEPLLAAAGYALTAVPDAHLCCGSAGTYSLLEPGISEELLRNKVAALESGAPDAIATANIGCLAHIASGTARPVRHWIELIDQRMA